MIYSHFLTLCDQKNRKIKFFTDNKKKPIWFFFYSSKKRQKSIFSKFFKLSGDASYRVWTGLGVLFRPQNHFSIPQAVFEKNRFFVQKTWVFEEQWIFNPRWQIRRQKLLPKVPLFLGRLPWRRGKRLNTSKSWTWHQKKLQPFGVVLWWWHDNTITQ